MGKVIEFGKDDAGKIQEYLKGLGIPVKSVTVGGEMVKVELEDIATSKDEINLANEMKKMGWL